MEFPVSPNRCVFVLSSSLFYSDTTVLFAPIPESCNSSAEAEDTKAKMNIMYAVYLLTFLNNFS